MRKKHSNVLLVRCFKQKSNLTMKKNNKHLPYKAPKSLATIELQINAVFYYYFLDVQKFYD